MSDWLIFLTVLAVVGLIVRREWRAHQTDLPGPALMDAAIGHRPGSQSSEAGEPGSDDDAWVGELHAINQLGKFGDLTRPIHLQTHYEVEAVIRQLRVPEWVPEQWRIAA